MGSTRLVLIGVTAAVLLTGCVAPLNGATSCGDFLDANVADREDIVGGAMDQRGVNHDQMFDLTIVSLQAGYACQQVDGDTPVSEVIAWDTWKPVMGG